VLDGAVLVISAVEGVKAQTHVLMRVLRRLTIPP
ncbi:MAG: GTP-binding protein, partial [Jiangellaceae bacterium]